MGGNLLICIDPPGGHASHGSQKRWKDFVLAFKKIKHKNKDLLHFDWRLSWNDIVYISSTRNQSRDPPATGTRLLWTQLCQISPPAIYCPAAAAATAAVCPQPAADVPSLESLGTDFTGFFCLSLSFTPTLAEAGFCISTNVTKHWVVFSPLYFGSCSAQLLSRIEQVDPGSAAANYLQEVHWTGNGRVDAGGWVAQQRLCHCLLKLETSSFTSTLCLHLSLWGIISSNHVLFFVFLNL